jgi:hypothetical protein
VLASDEPALPVLGVAVGVVRRFAEYDDVPCLFLPFHDSIVRKVAPQQISAAAEPDGPFRPAHSVGKAFDCRIENPVFAKVRIEAGSGYRSVGCQRGSSSILPLFAEDMCKSLPG